MPSPPITPLKLPRGVRTLLVYGGSFDPPHIYHAIAPLTILNRLYGEAGWLLYVPAATSPLKRRGPVASDEHRLAMLKLALDVPGRRSIWTDEIDRARWLRERGQDRASYTIDTLRRLRRIVPDRVAMRLLIGADQAALFHKWKDFRAVIRIGEPLVMLRPPVETVNQLYSALDKRAWTRAELAAWCTRMAPNFPMPPASTELRSAIAGAPEDPEAWPRDPVLGNLVTGVARYIIEHNLYGHRPGQPRRADREAVARMGLRGDDPRVLRSLNDPASLVNKAVRAFDEGVARAMDVLRGGDLRRGKTKRPRRA